MIVTKNIDSDKSSLFLKILNDESLSTKFHLRLKKGNISACDIGCGLPIYLIMLNEKYKLNKAVCIDKISEIELVKEYISKFDPDIFKDVTSLYDFYTKTGCKSISTKDEFKSIFIEHSHFGRPVEHTLMSCKETFDLVLCHNVMHLYDKKFDYEVFIGGAKKLSKADAIVFFRVENKFDFNYDEYKSVISRFFDGTIYEYYENGLFKSSYFINIED